jgi:amino acid permease
MLHRVRECAQRALKTPTTHPSKTPRPPTQPQRKNKQQQKSGFDLVCMGIGMMLGAGVFVTTGYVAADVAGPGVIISYLVAGVSAILSSFCYAEFAVDIPCAGGAYTYIAAALGEFLAWIAVCQPHLRVHPRQRGRGARVCPLLCRADQ